MQCKWKAQIKKLVQTCPDLPKLSIKAIKNVNIIDSRNSIANLENLPLLQ